MGGRPPADGAASGRDATVDTGDYGAGLGSVEHDAGEHDSRHDQRRLIVTGLGPGDLARLPVFHRNLLVDPAYSVVVRTMHHPAAAQLAELRPVVACDDLYERFEEFEDVYEAIADRVADYMAVGATIYAVPGSPMVGEFAVKKLLGRFPDAEVIPAESFVDAVLARMGYDPLDRGLRVINGHDLPHPLALDAPTIIGHLDRPEILADVSAALSRVLPEGARVTVLANLGADDESVVTVPVDEVPADVAGFRTSMFIDTDPAGLFGLVGVGRRLRAECPWDRSQTHHTLLRHLLEETYELVEAISRLPDDDEEIDYVAYDAVEDELGDVLLQVLFHAVIASEKGVFDIDDVASRLQEKLVRRHPHVFGDVEVEDAAEVAANWEQIKRQERGDEEPESLLDGVPAGLPALERAEALQRRAAKVGFDWETPEQIVEVLRQEVEELEAALVDDADAVSELGDVVFTAVNLLRRLGVTGEEALRRANARFEERFRAMEAEGPLEGLTLEEMDARWQAAKEKLGRSVG